MKEIYRQILGLPEYQELKKAVDSGKLPVLLQGVSPVHKAQFLHTLSVDSGRGAVLLTPDEQSAARLAEEINLLQGEVIAHHYPERDVTYHGVDSISREYEHIRLSVLARMLADKQTICVASVEAALQTTLPPSELTLHTIVLKSGMEYPQDEMLRQLVWAGYTHTEQVDGISQFASRGGIVDFYPPDYPHPVRVEFWGDEIDTMSAFSLETQRREDMLDTAAITPAREVLYHSDELADTLQAQYNSLSEKQREHGGKSLLRDIDLLRGGSDINTTDRYISAVYPNQTTLLSYLDDRLFVLSEAISIKESADALRWRQEEELKQLLEDGITTRACTGVYQDYALIESQIVKHGIIFDNFPRIYKAFAIAHTIDIVANTLAVWSGQLDTIVEELEHFLSIGYGCIVLNGTKRGAIALADDLRSRKINAAYNVDRGAFEKGRVFVCEGGLSGGVDYPQCGIAIFSYGRAAHLSTKKRKKIPKGQKAIKDIADLSVGDYVVHSTHGIGVFEGIVKREVQGVIKDYIKMRYAGTDMLFVPVTQLDLVTKYIGGKDENHVKLSKLNSTEWTKTRQRVKKACSDMAKELIALYAKRLQTKGYSFDEDTEWQKDFEQKFDYDETEDQLRCINEIKSDMERNIPMDRLLCGDVGFGKTEVALRGIFKCIMDSKQCAVMVPTTILAWQHYQTFLRRLEGYPIKVELLSRFRSPKQQKEVLKGLKDGTVDVVVGTHKLVQKDVEFKDLGLCVIDEEQRFGVAHKERFKELRASVDVLTLSATPIPRTLNMAMSGIRDMSIIGEAPQDRHPVQTYVLEYDDSIVVEAMRKELRRGGQVFYLHNRVGDIDDVVSNILKNMPDAKVQSAHGKMSEEALSKVWKQLVEREIDILVCTTIIETGVDVPNCNTLIIEDSDRMGLSQLYQLRGRVGRSGRRAYAYFTFRRGKILTEVGEKRLSAIREFTSFGSGFRIAMRDLEIRGAGDILGSSQHGHMESVGYDLYLKLLSDAISEERGEKVAHSTECQVDLQIAAHIPEDYISSLTQRVDIYKKIACVTNREQYMDMIDELIDRFGEPPSTVKGLLDVAMVRGSAAMHGISEIKQNGNFVLLYPETPDMQAIISMVQRMGGRALLNAGKRPYISIKLQKNKQPIDAIHEVFGLLDATEVE